MKYDVCSTERIILTGWITRGNTCPSATFSPPQIPYGPVWDRTWSSATGCRLIA